MVPPNKMVRLVMFVKANNDVSLKHLIKYDMQHEMSRNE